MAAQPALTPARRAVAAALLFWAAATLAGVSLAERGVEYRVFGLTEGVFALLLTFVLTGRGAWVPPPGWTGALPLVYGTLANAQLLELLLPPPGILEWGVLTVLAFSAWAALGAASPRRLLGSLATLALLLAMLKFSVLPVLWERSGPAAGEAFGLGNFAEAARRWLSARPPDRPAGQLLGFLGLAAWAVATRLLWPAGRAAAPPATVPPEGVDRGEPA